MDLFKYDYSAGSFEPAPSVLKTKTSIINSPSEATLNLHGYWPKRDVLPPAEEEGFKIIDRGVTLEDDPENPGKKFYLNRKYDKLQIVDDGEPELAEDEELYRDYWAEIGNTWQHVYAVLKVIDPGEPELAEGQSIVKTDWEIDEDAGTKTKTYMVRVVVDNPPELKEGQEIIEDHWDDDGETYTHVYTVRKIVDVPPELADNQFIYDDHWDDDGETRTHVYDVWTLVDEKPEEQEGKVIRDYGFEDNAETKTRTHIYKVKTLIDERPEDDPDGNYYYVEDGEDETETEVIKRYRYVEKVWRKFSKLYLEAALFKIGKLDAFDAFIDTLTMKNELGQEVGLRRFYNQANELGENHPMFKPYYAAALTALDLTPEQGEAILEECIAK